MLSTGNLCGSCQTRGVRQKNETDRANVPLHSLALCRRDYCGRLIKSNRHRFGPLNAGRTRLFACSSFHPSSVCNHAREDGEEEWIPIGPRRPRGCLSGYCVSDGLNITEMKTKPNNAMERSRMLVTVRAYARPAPIIRLAHLRRSAE